MTQLTVTGNTAGDGGGGMYLYASSPAVTSAILAYNGGSYNVYQNDYQPGTPLFRYSTLYGPSGNNTYNLSLDETNLQVEPGFLEYGYSSSLEMEVPTDLHLALESALIDAGDPEGASDVDGSRADPGCSGGSGGAGWDRDGDGWYDYFWPGRMEDAPDGFDPLDYDLDDLSASIH